MPQTFGEIYQNLDFTERDVISQLSFSIVSK